MPLYPYRCTQCGHRFEKIQNFSSTPETECPVCKGVLERLLTAPGLQFKGAGWYVNDYTSKSSGSGNDSQGSDGKATGKSESGDAAAATPATKSETAGSKSETPASSKSASTTSASSTAS